MKDELFLRGAQVPMTKEAVRALALAKLELHRARHLIDIGAGTGSVSIEAALQNPALRVTAIERQADALRRAAEVLACDADTPPEIIADALKAIGPEHSLMSTDSGQVINPAPAESMESYIYEMLKLDVPADDIYTMTHTNPAMLLDLE